MVLTADASERTVKHMKRKPARGIVALWSGSTLTSAQLAMPRNPPPCSALPTNTLRGCAQNILPDKEDHNLDFKYKIADVAKEFGVPTKKVIETVAPITGELQDRQHLLVKRN